MTDRRHWGCVVLAFILAGCATTRGMEIHAADGCHRQADPFSTYTLTFVSVPGFIERPIETAAEGALGAIGLVRADTAEAADLEVINTFVAEDRNPPPRETDPMGERVQTGTVNRFVARLEVAVRDRRTDSVLWTGAMYRDHAVSGGETFHSERAILLIRQAYDEMFVGLTRSCG